MSSKNEDRRIDRELHRRSGGTDPFAAAVRATRMPMLITDPRQSDNPIVFVNDAFGRLTGYSREETLGRNCRFLQGPGTNAEDVGRVREAINRRVPIEIDLLNYRRDGTTFWNRLLISPVFDDNELTFFFASQFDITPERERMSRLAEDRDALESEITQRVSDLTSTEDRLKFTLAAGRLGAWTLDVPSGRLVASGMCKSNFGRGPADTFTYQDLRDSVIPNDLGRWEKAVADAAHGTGDLDVEYRIRTPDGDVRWIEVRAQTRFDSHGKPISMAGVSLDITDRKQAENHRDLLTKELSHRVKNTLATVQSIVGQSLREQDVPDHVLLVVAQRLQALAGAHDVLTSSGWESAKISALVRSVLVPFDTTTPTRFHAGGDDVDLSARAATALALALHELATNAVKYGALSNDTGKVILNWHVEGEQFTLVWTEVGGPTVSAPTRTGFGSRLIEAALSSSINGQAKIDYRPDGIVFTMTTSKSQLKSENGPSRDY